MNYAALFLYPYELRYLPVRTSYGKAPFVFVFFCFGTYERQDGTVLAGREQ